MRGRALLCAAMLGVSVVAASAQTPSDLFQRALVQERIAGKLDSAIALYQQVVRRAGSDRALAARALLNLGRAYELLGRTEARGAYERLLRDFGDQRDLAAQARVRIAALEPAAQQSGTRRPAGPATQRVTTNSDAMYLFGGPSPDGRFIWYSDRVTRDLVSYDLRSESYRHVVMGDWPRSGTFVDRSVVSPDGREIAYTWALTHPSESQLRIVSATGGESRVVLRGVRAISPYGWTPDGKSVLAKVDDALDLIDVANGRLRPLLNPTAAFPIAAGVSPDGQWVVFDMPANDALEANPDIYIIGADGTRRHVVVEHPGSDWSPHWTPDGRGIVFLSDRNGAWGLWFLAIADGEVRAEPVLIKAEVGRVQLLGFSRDGRLFYTPLASLYLTVDGLDSQTGQLQGQPKIIGLTSAGSVVAGEYATGPDWSPDGQSLAFITGRGLSPTQPIRILTIVDLATGHQREFTVPLARYQNPRWSRDGRAILVGGSGEGHDSGYQRVDAATGALETIAPMPNGAARAGEWSGDGRSIFYPRPDSAGATSLWRYDLNDTTRHVVYAPDSLRSVEALAASPDGRWIALTATYQTKESSRRSQILSLVTGEIRDLPLPPLSAADTSKHYDGFTWLAAGDLIAARRRRSDSVELWRVPLDGSSVRKFAGEFKATSLPRVSPDGRLVAIPRQIENAGGIWTMENFLPAARAGKPGAPPE